MTALGVALLLIGATAVLVEAHFPTLGALGAPGVVGLAAGSVLAVAGLGGGFVTAVVVALLVALAGAAVVAVTVRKGVAVRRRRIRSGPEGIVGRIGVVRSWSEQAEDGKVLVDGALWQARPSLLLDDAPAPLHPGDRVVVERLSGLTLCVRRAEEWELIAR
jgi:membrane-bound serine protease (ClpP class)